MSTFSELENDLSVRCAVLTGIGKAFSVGSDINDFSQEVAGCLKMTIGNHLKPNGGGCQISDHRSL